MSTAPALPDKPKRRGLLYGIIAAVVVVVVVVVAIVLGTRDDSAKTTAAGSTAAAKTVKIGVADKSLKYWTPYVELAKSKYDVDVELVNFSDYTQPNPALSQNQLDLNQFQHIQYLANYNATSGDDLQPIGATAVYPLPLYSLTAKSVAELPADAKVAIPNDAINEARGLLVLQQAGLVTLKDGGTAFSKTNDIESSKVQVTTVAADQTASALQSGSVAAAIVNNNYATKAKLPVDDIIVKDDPSSPAAAPYVNIFAARKADVANQTYLDLAALWHDPAVQKVFLEENPGAVVQDTPAADLQAETTKVEADAKAAAGK
ncbi:MetQ/NlpA family ABC transporter substrate-binding protein [Kineococcus rhizosphaerae]|uniref:D-methionine transport system substrate-binding protein n=1 Tax=Kineococcus rhizosphaerae TaxID=559628 RepID=A0A2T0R0U5_9ACTN|nr:MetQ/NlpA family ABC transporter substrate-binding protein [Kineococcus rhizosphaerae]PRY12920.1 D-methionine transport system substrate-binding protein [Kineococcus rhizosphaerae]